MRWIVTLLTATAAASLVALPVSAAVLYSTGFEAPSFSLGGLNGQGGWAIDDLGPAPADQVVVENTATHGGGQAVEIPSSAGGLTAYYAFGPITPTKRLVVSMAINNDTIRDVVGGEFAVATSPGYQNVTAGVILSGYAGEIRALSAGAPAAETLIGGFTPGTWIDVSMTLDYQTQTYSVSVDGALRASGLRFCGDAPSSSTCSGDPISQFAIVEYIPRIPKGPTGPTLLDDLSISTVPEPDAWALAMVGAALAGASLRHRRGAPARTVREARV